MADRKVEEKIVVYFDFDEADYLYGQIELLSASATTGESQVEKPVSIPSTSHNLLISWWEEIEGETTLFSNEAATYFYEIFNKTCSNKLFTKFSQDGIDKIPNMFPDLNRIEALELAQKMFDKALASRASRREKKCGAISQTGNPVSDDDRHIIEYIAGYILSKLRKRYSADYDVHMFVEQLCDFDSAFSSDSLIKIMQNPKFGTLVMPLRELVDVLVYVENVFRACSSVRDCLNNVMKSLNMRYIYELMYPLDVNEECLLFICKFFIKIRCFQLYGCRCTWCEQKTSS